MYNLNANKQCIMALVIFVIEKKNCSVQIQTKQFIPGRSTKPTTDLLNRDKDVQDNKLLISVGECSF